MHVVAAEPQHNTAAVSSLSAAMSSKQCEYKQCSSLTEGADAAMPLGPQVAKLLSQVALYIMKETATKDTPCHG